MAKAIVITPVKDAIGRTLATIRAIHESDADILHLVYNDFSSAETKAVLEQSKDQYGYELVHLEDMTTHPSPNYRLVLQDAQRRALHNDLPLIIVESDVIVKPDTLGQLLDFYYQHPNTGLAGAVTVDEQGQVNFPYLRFKEQPNEARVIETKKSLSFCCTLIAVEFLRKYDFAYLNESKDWFDTFISYQATDMGFRNYLLYDVPVLHSPHGSRPWKQLKYTNPLKYYLLKFLKRRDKI
ncbi:glycosyltransferase [Parapedobacter koreensis]|uniref:Glycosyl transferase family 2 n=1 Tax=Parapedobacter koreensis TaxID=332977 RepID=A0A1H7GD64_9SPHI|nr:glycosyltransferase [Parapedobacter koreensis]SEK36068.1 Glycosyl transferase family 2 [Parapedobacter koreensis]